MPERVPWPRYCASPLWSRSFSTVRGLPFKACTKCADCGITDKGAEALAEAIRNDCPLTEIYLDSTHLDLTHTERQTCTIITNLPYSDNPIGDRGLSAIASAVEESTSLSWLFLDQSALPGAAMHYTLDGVLRVRDALSRSTSIQAVRLSLGNDSWLQTGASFTSLW